MRPDLVTLLDDLCDRAGASGAGVADRAGLRIQSAGLQDGLEADALAAVLAPPPQTELAELTGDAFCERITLGERRLFAVRWFGGGRWFVWVVAPAGARLVPIRTEIRSAADELEARFTGTGLLVTARDRLHEPRKFAGRPLLR